LRSSSRTNRTADRRKACRRLGTAAQVQNCEHMPGLLTRVLITVAFCQRCVTCIQNFMCLCAERVTEHSGAPLLRPRPHCNSPAGCNYALQALKAAHLHLPDGEARNWAVLEWHLLGLVAQLQQPGRAEQWVQGYLKKYKPSWMCAKVLEAQTRWSSSLRERQQSTAEPVKLTAGSCVICSPPSSTANLPLSCHAKGACWLKCQGSRLAGGSKDMFSQPGPTLLCALIRPPRYACAVLLGHSRL
jgi:hypothetical protein